MSVLLTLCTLLLLAYVFDWSAARTRIPSVILLIVLGWLVRQLTNGFNIIIPDLSDILPLLGTVGLILIVLEGSLELEFNRSKTKEVRTAFLAALLPLLVLAAVLAGAWVWLGYGSWQSALANALPICVISSAIAIPTARALPSSLKSFVVYESSLSDIIGVLVFNAVALHAEPGWDRMLTFIVQLAVMALISLVATLGLSYLLQRIDHSIKFVPIILLLILIYGLAKAFHLPALIFILIFGLFLGNSAELKQWRLLKAIHPEKLQPEVQRFHELITEFTFLVRSLFFLLFGYLIETSEITDTRSLGWALGITALLFLLRALTLKWLKQQVFPLLFLAPRGLITILLFLSLAEGDRLPVAGKPLILQIIVLTALVMMLGMMSYRRPEKTG